MLLTSLSGSSSVLFSSLAALMFFNKRDDPGDFSRALRPSKREARQLAFELTDVTLTSIPELRRYQKVRRQLFEVLGHLAAVVDDQALDL